MGCQRHKVKASPLIPWALVWHALSCVFSFEELQDALVLAKQGRLGQPNAVIEIERPS
jgi:hypothetical protein